jgi:hypothetical protein
VTTPSKRLDELDAQEKAIDAERREIYRASMEAPEAEKVCSDDMAELLAGVPVGTNDSEPFVLRRIFQGESEALSTRGTLRKPGTFVAIRPCAKECEGRTYLGLYLGDLAMGFMTHVSREIEAIKIDFSWYNPAIWVFDLNKVVLGAESWWNPIKSEKHLRQITNNDIDNVWYVRAMRQMVGIGGENGSDG